jgi:hypothetical protein
MKDFVSKLVLVLLFVFCTSTVWAQKGGSDDKSAWQGKQQLGPYLALTADERTNVNVLGKITRKVHKVPSVVSITMPEYSLKDAYEELLGELEVEYPSSSELRHVTLKLDKYYPWTHEADFIIEGTVISKRGISGVGVEGALARAAKEVSRDFPSRSRIAIVQITGPDRGTRDYMIGELEHILRGRGYS